MDERNWLTNETLKRTDSRKSKVWGDEGGKEAEYREPSWE